MPASGPLQPPGDRAKAQQTADRIRTLHEELNGDELKSVLALTPEQHQRFADWSSAKLAALAAEYDVDTTSSQKQISWGMRIASTLGGIAICAAVILFFSRYWGYLQTWFQIVIVILTPGLALAGAEYMARRERTRYFTGLLALVALAGFVMNLVVIGSVFNFVSTEKALLAWSAFSIVLAYRYGLRLLLALGLLASVGYAAALLTVRLGYRWLDFYERPEVFILLGALIFTVPSVVRHPIHGNFPPVYRLTGGLVVFFSILSLAEWGAASYLLWDTKNIERFYEIAGLLISTGAVWLGIARSWSGIVNAGATFFTIFLFTRLYHWWWEWMPKYLFFAIIGAIGIGLVAAFRQIRTRMLTLPTGTTA